MPMLRAAAVVVLAAVVALVLPWPRPPAPRAQGVDVFLNVTGGGSKKLNLALPEFTLMGGSDPRGLARELAAVAAADLTFSGLFQVVGATGAILPNNPESMKKLWADFAAAGAHAGLHGLLTLQGDRALVESRLYDLTSPDFRLIATKRFEMSLAQARRLAHKVADDVVLQFTGELGVADTKLAFVRGPKGSREIYLSDYDGAGTAPVTRNGSINMSPAWSPDARSLAYTSFTRGYPDLYRAFPFERRPEQLLAGFSGINSSPAWSPDGQHVALTLSKDGNPEVYVLSVATGAFRRLTRHAGIDTEPTWAPSGRQLAFVSDRTGTPHIFVMDAEGASVRQITSGGMHTQPRWSPKGDLIAYTVRQGSHNLWAVNPDGTGARALTTGGGDSQSASWSPNGRHLAFQTNRLGTWAIFAMFADGSEQAPLVRGTTEATSPSWSPRLP